MAYTSAEQELIDRVRQQMSMQYSSLSSSDYIQAQKFTDEEIYWFLQSALGDFNLWAPRPSNYTIDTLISENSGYSQVLIMGACIYGLIALEFYEAGMHFNVSDDGHSITRDRQPKYANILSQLWQVYADMLGRTKLMWAMSNMRIHALFTPLASVPYASYKGTRTVHGGLWGYGRRNMR